MSTPRRSLRLFAASLVIGVSLPLAAPALAQSTRDKIIEMTTQSLKASGAKEIVFGKVEGDDARFVISDTRISSEVEGKKTAMTFAKTTWTGAVPAADGGYDAAEIAVEGMRVEGDDAKITADKLVLTNYHGVAPAKVVPGKITGERVEKAVATGIVVDTEDGKKVPIASVSFAASDYVGDTPRKAAFDLKGIEVTLDPKDPDLAPARALGYEKLSIDAGFAGTWDDKTGRLDIARITVGAAQAGELQLSGVIGGLTPATVDALKKADGDNAKEMEILQGLTVEKLTLRWNDGSLATRVLDMQAKEQGTDAKTYAKQLKLLIPAVLSMMGNKDFEKKVASAAGTFLDAPKSLTIAAKPATPVSFGQIMGTAMTAPQALPNVLAAEVTAND